MTVVEKSLRNMFERGYKHGYEDALKKNKGEWISEYDEDGKTGWYECSCCHSERAFNTNFCPDCGADMRVENEVKPNE